MERSSENVSLEKLSTRYPNLTKVDAHEDSGIEKERKEIVKWDPKKSGWHFIAGGIGGMAGAVVTSPLDVVKTRLQSSLFDSKSSSAHPTLSPGSSAVAPSSSRLPSPATLPANQPIQSRSFWSRIPGQRLMYNFVETGVILKNIYTHEGPSALFKGLTPTLAGVIPARSINFFVYGNGKQIIAQHFNNGQESSLVHLTAAANAGIVTSFVTNPIWVVKTRLQLSTAGKLSGGKVEFNSGWSCFTHILRTEGVRALYRGLSASLLGVSEGVIQWTLYERFKKIANNSDYGPIAVWSGTLGSAGGAKMIASLITYPHEVLRTRLRQPPVTETGLPKYTGLLQTLKLVLKEEGFARMYGGLSAHLLRVVPNAAIMYGVYELALTWQK